MHPTPPLRRGLQKHIASAFTSGGTRSRAGHWNRNRGGTCDALARGRNGVSTARPRVRRDAILIGQVAAVKHGVVRSLCTKRIVPTPEAGQVDFNAVRRGKFNAVGERYGKASGRQGPRDGAPCQAKVGAGCRARLDGVDGKPCCLGPARQRREECRRQQSLRGGREGERASSSTPARQRTRRREPCRRGHHAREPAPHCPVDHSRCGPRSLCWCGRELAKRATRSFAPRDENLTCVASRSLPPPTQPATLSFFASSILSPALARTLEFYVSNWSEDR